MPYRNLCLTAAIVGVIVAAILLIVGINVHRASQTGPAWRRRLIAAGLVLMASFGMIVVPSGCGSKSQPGSSTSGKSDSSADRSADQSISQSADPLAAVCDDWRSLEQLAGASSSTSSQRRVADQKKQNIMAAITSLCEKNELTDPEGQLLQMELALVMERIYANPPTDFTGTCYAPMLVDPVAKSAERINARLEILRRGGVDELKPTVIRKILDSFEKDIAVIAGPENSEKIGKEDREKLCERAGETVRQMKGRLAGK